MAKNLQKGGKKLPLYFRKGEVLVIKSTLFNLTESSFPFPCDTHLDLYNDNDDIILRITFRKGKKKIFCNDQTSKSLLDGWGEERSADLPVDADRWTYRGVAISVYASGWHRFQILFNLTTLGYFDSRFEGPATQIGYSQHSPNDFLLSDSLQVYCHIIFALQPEERKAIQSGRAPPLKIVPEDSKEISVRPSHFKPEGIYASIRWDDGKEIRTYCLGPGNILQEFAYSEIKDRNSLYYGNLHSLKIVLHPTSNVTAVRHEDSGRISIYYQDPNDGFIRTLSQHGTAGEWRKDPTTVARAIQGSNIAVITPHNGLGPYSVYYQDPELHLRERYYDLSKRQWILGDFNPGVQGRGTPITAEVVRGGDVDINVAWRDARGRFASASWSKSSGWDLPKTNVGSAPQDGRD